MTAREYLSSLHTPIGFNNPYEKLTEQECLDKLIESHKRIRGHYVYHLEKPLREITQGINKVLSEVNKF